MRSRLLAAVLLCSTLLVLAPPGDAATGWMAVVRNHGGRLEACVLSAPGEKTKGWILKVRANNSNAAHAHRFGVSRLVGGGQGAKKPLWNTRTAAGKVSPAVKVELAGAADWLSVGMSEGDGDGAFGGGIEPKDVRRC